MIYINCKWTCNETKLLEVINKKDEPINDALMFKKLLKKISLFDANIYLDFQFMNQLIKKFPQ